MKLDIIYHYEVNPDTGEITYIGKDELTVDTLVKKQSKATKEEGSRPIIKLLPNKLELSSAAIALLKASAGDAIDIKYKAINNKSVPVIGTDKSFGTVGGNKLTKSNTISFRGNANENLLQHGNEFTLEPTNDDGIFVLLGNKQVNSDIPEEIIDIEQELEELDLLDELEIEKDETELDKFNFIL